MRMRRMFRILTKRHDMTRHDMCDAIPAGVLACRRMYEHEQAYRECTPYSYIHLRLHVAHYEYDSEAITTLLG